MSDPKYWLLGCCAPPVTGRPRWSAYGTTRRAIAAVAVRDGIYRQREVSCGLLDRRGNQRRLVLIKAGRGYPPLGPCEARKISMSTAREDWLWHTFRSLTWPTCVLTGGPFRGIGADQGQNRDDGGRLPRLQDAVTPHPRPGHQIHRQHRFGLPPLLRGSWRTFPLTRPPNWRPPSVGRPRRS